MTKQGLTPCRMAIFTELRGAHNAVELRNCRQPRAVMVLGSLLLRFRGG